MSKKFKNTSENRKKIFEQTRIKICTNLNTVTSSGLGVNLWKIIWENYKKIDKISRGGWGTLEKIRSKLEKILVSSNICWNFEKKLVEYSEKVAEILKIYEKIFKKLEEIMNKICVNPTKNLLKFCTRFSGNFRNVW